MCVLICGVGQRPFLAANRDEAYARPFSAPRPWVAATPFWAPRDEEEGGTWVGVNRAGLIAAITNRSRMTERPGLASRGHLVVGLLSQPDLAAARAWLDAGLGAAACNPCQLYAAQGDRAFVCRVAPDGFGVEDLLPGIHVLSNFHDPDEIDFGIGENASWDELRIILADASPRLPRGYSVCKRAGWRGTVASAFIEPARTFLFADGPPDVTGYTPVPGYP